MEPNWIEFWYTALNADVGICIETDNTERCKMKLYAARVAAADPDLMKLSIVQSPTDPCQLWIIQKETPSAS